MTEVNGKKKCISPLTGAEMGVTKSGRRVKHKQHMKRRQIILSNSLIEGFHDDFKQHGVEAIKRLRQENLGKYMDICTKLMPKEGEGVTKSDLQEFLEKIKANREEFARTVVESNS